MSRTRIKGFAHPFLVILFLLVVILNLIVARYLSTKKIDAENSFAYGSCATFADYCSKRVPCCDPRWVCRTDPSVLSGEKVCLWPRR